MKFRHNDTNKKLQRPSFERRCKITATNCLKTADTKSIFILVVIQVLLLQFPVIGPNLDEFEQDENTVYHLV